MSNIIDSIQLSGTVYTLSAQSSGGSPTVELTQAEYDALVSAGTVAEDTYYIITDAQAGDLSNYWTSAETQSAITAAISGKVDTSAITTSITSSSTDAQVPSAKAVNDKLGGLSIVKLTQAEYDALSPNYDSNTLYVIVN